MRIGMFLLSPIEVGGGFQQALSTITAVKGEQGDYEILAITLSKTALQRAEAAGLNAVLLSYSRFDRWMDLLDSSSIGGALFTALRRAGFRKAGRRLDGIMQSLGIDLVVFNEPSTIAQCLADHPYIVTVFDLCHRDWPEFPEVYANREFERRDRMYRQMLPRALGVIVSAPSLSRQVAELYGVSLPQIVELPFLPSLAVRKYAAGDRKVTPEQVRSKYAIPEDYIFYPAQFWPHKNHIYLLDGLVELERSHGISIHAVFSGSEKGNLHAVRAHARKLGLLDRVLFLGFVPDEEIPPLYAGALALVMPTYFGPTNLPPLEAVTLGCPAIYSDFPEFRAHMGDAVLYCDLKDPASLAMHLAQLSVDQTIAETLRQKGCLLLEGLTPEIYINRLAKIWDAFAYLRQRWT